MTSVNQNVNILLWKKKEFPLALKVEFNKTLSTLLGGIEMGLFRFKPKWQHKNPYKRERAVKELYDTNDEHHKILVDIVKNDEKPDVRRAAIKQLEDQKTIADIAKNDEDWLVRREAVKKLEDQKVIADIAKNDEVYYVREEAVRKLEDQKILAHIAKNDKHEGVILEAKGKLKDPSVVALIDEHIKQMRKEKFNRIKEGISLSEVKDILGIHYTVAGGAVSALFGSKTAATASYGQEYFTWDRPEGKWQLVFKDSILVQIYGKPWNI